MSSEGSAPSTTDTGPGGCGVMSTSTSVCVREREGREKGEREGERRKEWKKSVCAFVCM